ncbi:MAG: type I restriction endonuclease [Chloroflexi bacterium]|nr:type I restriction endonuclease [Chloroflexota bacterium]
MDLIDRMREISSQAPRQLEFIKTEEATKNAFVMPFIQALGYNVFNPIEVVPEFTADVGTKKHEKVDYAIMQDGKPIILIEVKSATSDLKDEHASQLFRYFSVTDARIGILTNGLQYRFHSDLEKPNHMDEKPFLIVDILNFDTRPVSQLKKFSKSAFDVDRILSSANELKYKREIKLLFESEYHQPSEDFVRHFAGRVYSGRLMANVIAEFTEITKQALREFLNDEIADRLQTAIDSTAGNSDETSDESAVDEEVIDRSDGIETTEEELDGYYVVKSILRETIDVSRVFIRDVRSYCGILLDDNNRQPICRLHFNRSTKYLGLFDGDSEERVAIDSVDSIYNYASEIRAAVAKYDSDD